MDNKEEMMPKKRLSFYQILPCSLSLVLFLEPLHQGGVSDGQYFHSGTAGIRSNIWPVYPLLGLAQEIKKSEAIFIKLGMHF